ncbi:hypothetical protein NQ315_009763 [Exocentrus adspersus]|uniref:Cysteine proteinase n=1 Tax=Exocentrus adspersus TaxID=1586481 RepID=A0AAV8WI27_9CUCU|nr:hypothetical protein NQ315_009763 [Exocentrus adspersus]
MMCVVKLTFILIFCALRGHASDGNENSDRAPQVSAVLSYLNSNPNKIYDYKKGNYVTSQQKANIVELTVDVEVSCSVNYPGVPCTDQVLTCNGFLRHNGGNEYQVLSDVMCKPKREASAENFEELGTSPVIPIQQDAQIELSHEAVSSEQNADFVAVKADAVPCLGCPFDLNTDVDGVSLMVDTALKHIESERTQKHVALKVVRLQQQVVAGIKYILTLEVAPTVCRKEVDYIPSSCPLNADSAVCEITFLQKPWVSMDKLIIRNNCTTSQEYATQHKRNDISNEINTNADTDYKTTTGGMDPQRMSDLESQIFLLQPETTKPASRNDMGINQQHEVIGDASNNNNVNEPFVATELQSTPSTKSDSTEDTASPTLFYNVNQETTIITSEGDTSEVVVQEASRMKRETKNVTESTNKSSSESSESKEDSKSDISSDKLKLINPRRRRELDNSDSKSSESHEGSRSKRDADNTSSKSSESHEDDNTREVRSKRDTGESHSKSSENYEDDNTEEVRSKREADNDGLKSSGSSQEDNTRESRTKRDTVDSPDNVRIKRKHDSDSSSDSSSSEDKSKKSKEEKKDSSSSSSSSSADKSREKQRHHKRDDSSSSSSDSSSEENKKKHSTGQNENDASGAAHINVVKRSIGQLEKITQEEKFLVRDLADFAASSLDNIDDDNHKRVILQILGAKKLKLDGIYYHIILRLGISQCTENDEDDNCIEKLFTNHTKICKVLVHVEDDLSNPKVVKSQCQSTKKDDRDRNRTNYSRYRRRRDTLVGAPSNISTDDPRIQEFTTTTLAHLDSQSEDPNKHKLVNVVSATSQVVAGAKYRIKVTVGLSDCSKNDTKLPEECAVNPDNYKTCEIVVWDQPWLHRQEYSVKCDNEDKEYRFENNKARGVRSITDNVITDFDSLEKPGSAKERNLGQSEQQSPDDLKASSYLRDILSYLDNESGHYNKLKIQEVVSVNKQVVAGELWRIKARVALSECPKTKSTDPQLCNKLEGSEVRTCVFKIWDRPWLPHGREVQTSCENESKPYSFRLKRSLASSERNLAGSLEQSDELAWKYLDYIKSGLEYMESKQSNDNKYTLKSLKKVSKSVVAGQIWNVTAEVAVTLCKMRYFVLHCQPLVENKLKTCNFMIWEQSWSPTAVQVNITCDGDNNVYSFNPNTFADDSNTSSYKQQLVATFHAFIIRHNKTYLSDIEYNYRLKVFKDNLNVINLLNTYELGTGRYALNQFADMTAREFSKSHGLRLDLARENETPFANAVIPDIDLPKEFDWREKGAVTEVKNQGSCGSCWAFSTTGNIEGQYAIKYGKLLEFSEQELVDCDKLDEGCNGGLMDNAYRTIEKIGGLEAESDYPYDAEDEKCHFNKTMVRVQLSGAVNISHDETDMAKWLVKNGPISIAINANAMQFYAGGVSHPWKVLCNPKNLDHGVLIVGYGVHDYPKFNKTLPYWIVKNSWGTRWGEQGYYRVYRGDGTCGLNQTPSSAIVA